MSAPVCTTCGKEHAWVLISNHYDEICGDCVEEDPRVEFCTEEDRYAIFSYCACGARGPVNYGVGEVDYRFYCGGPNSCCRP